MYSTKPNKYLLLSKKDKDKLKKLVKQSIDGEIKTEIVLDIINDMTENGRRSCQKIVRRIKEENGWVDKKIGIKDTEQFINASKKKKINSKYHLITSIQNETPVHLEMIEGMEVLANDIGAEISVIPLLYKNVTSVLNDAKDVVWDKRIEKYLVANRQNLNNNITVLGDVMTQPTAVNPLTGFDTITMEQSCIVGHPKIHLNTMAVLQGYPEKILMTTGACNKENYTKTKAGAKGDFNHQLGFVIVEIRNKEVFHARQVTVNKDGSFTDLMHKVKDGKITKVNQFESIILGDLHVGEHDTKLINKSLPLINMAKTCVLHDVFNGKSVNPHIKDFEKIQLIKKGLNTIDGELDYMYKYLKWFDKQTPNTKKYIVRSNHDEFLDRYIEDGKFKMDLANAGAYFRLANLKVTQNVPCLIDHLISDNVPQYEYIDYTSNLRIKSYELGTHGHKGSNGARGGTTSASKLSTKTIQGHNHSAFRKDGHLRVGTSTIIPLDYQLGGASSSIQSHVIIHEDGKAQHLLFIKGNFTTFKI